MGQKPLSSCINIILSYTQTICICLTVRVQHCVSHSWVDIKPTPKYRDGWSVKQLSNEDKDIYKFSCA